MSKHTLSLEAPDTRNTKIFRVLDTSVYSDDIPVDCPILNITLPGFTYSAELGQDDISSGFALNLTACDLELQTEGCGTTLSKFPDGVYVIKYSVSPNDIIYVEYNHLRVTDLLNLYSAILCELDIADCEPSVETSKKLKELGVIKTYIDAAKAKVEICHEAKKGMQLYTYAKNLLSKFDCSGCTSC